MRNGAATTNGDAWNQKTTWNQRTAVHRPQQGNGVPMRPAAPSVPTGALSRFPLALVVEPDPDLGRVYGLLLKREGVTRVITLDSGLEAFSAAMAERPDLILTEIGLPNQDGITLLRRLRAEPALRDLAAVVITSQTGAELARYAAEVGAALLLHKPVSFRTLGARLVEGLARAPGRLPAQSGVAPR